MTMARLKVMNLKENVHQDDIIKKIALVLQFKDSGITKGGYEQ